MSAQGDMFGGLPVFTQLSQHGSAGNAGSGIQSGSGASGILAPATSLRGDADTSPAQGEFARLLGGFTAEAADPPAVADKAIAPPSLPVDASLERALARVSDAMSALAGTVDASLMPGAAALAELMEALKALQDLLGAAVEGGAAVGSQSVQAALDELSRMLQSSPMLGQLLVAADGSAQMASAAGLSTSPAAHSNGRTDGQPGLASGSSAALEALRSAMSRLERSLQHATPAAERMSGDMPMNAMPAEQAASLEEVVLQRDGSSTVRRSRGEWPEAMNLARGRMAEGAMATTAFAGNTSGAGGEAARGGSALSALMQAQGSAAPSAANPAGAAQSAPAPNALAAESPLRLAQSADWPSALSTRIAWMLEGGREQADLQLDPPRLGQIAVRINTEGDQLSVNFISANPQVRDALESALPRLREMMAEQGLSGLAVNIESGASGERESQRLAGSGTAADGSDEGDAPVDTAAADGAAPRHSTRLFEGYA